MLCMSLNLVLLLLLWEISCTGYQRYHLLPLSLWLLKKNAVSSFPKLGNSFSWWSAPRARRRLWPRPLDIAPLHDNNKWTRLWRSTGTSSPHPQEFLYTVRSSTRLIWPQVRRYPMDRSIDALFWRMMKSRGRFRSCCRKVTFVQVHRPVGARSCWYRRRMGLGDSVLVIGRWTRSLSEIGTRSHGLMAFWTNSKVQNISARSTWSLGITRYQLNPLMCGILPSNPRKAFSNGWSCLSSWRMLPQPSWG